MLINYIYIHIYDMSGKLILSKENLVLTDKIEGFIQKKITPFVTRFEIDPEISKLSMISLSS